jgi:hypothetical protein
MSHTGGIRGWTRTVRETWPYAVGVISLLFATAIGTAFAWSFVNGARSFREFAATGLEPALSAALLCLCAGLAPSLYAGKRLIITHVISLPILWASFILLGRQGVSASGLDLIAVPSLDKFFMIWADWRMVAVVWGAQTIVLLLTMVRTNRKAAANSVE